MMKKRKIKRSWWLLSFCALCALVAVFVRYPERFPGGTWLVQRLRGKATVADRLAQYGPAARARWKPDFERQKITYPPSKLLLVGFKHEKRLEVYAADASTKLRLIRTYPILGASGRLGPKLRYGDMQVPEGFYRIESLNPNSAFHLSLRLNYPNEFDREHAQREGRTELGGDIMIHGSRASVGCLAMGDEAAEDLFVLAADAGRDNIQVVISPVDFRLMDILPDAARPKWTNDLYGQIKNALLKLPKQRTAYGLRRGHSALGAPLSLC